QTAESTARCNLTAAQDLVPTLVKVVYEVDGKLLSAPETAQGRPREHVMRGIANFLYEERFTDIANRQVVRYYDEAKADISASGRASEVRLRDDRRYVAIDPQQAGRSLRSLGGPLTRSELELIELPGGSSWVDQLLPGREAAVGEKWSHDEQLLGRLFNLDAVTANDLKTELVSVTADAAQLSMAGSVVGSVSGVVTELKVQGKLTFNRQLQRITWLALGLQEERSVGLGSPGLQATSRLRMLIDAGAVPHLDPQLVAAMTPSTMAGADLLEYRTNDGTLTFPHDRRWHLHSDQGGLIVLRRIEDGRVIAQCNLKPLLQLAPGQTLSLEQFQTEVRTALGTALQQVVEAKEEKLPSGVRQLRISVIGQVANAPVHWVYYQLSDAEGHQATCVFTMSGEDATRFGGEDVTLVSGIRFASDLDQSDQPAVPEEVAQSTDDSDAVR
ncbi:MAG: hypothetical protein KDB23_08220, partial [Planctomycetales bacterium]|nr:hypothetical protein [Planctomycetales bacterium]